MFSNVFIHICYNHVLRDSITSFLDTSLKISKQTTFFRRLYELDLNRLQRLFKRINVLSKSNNQTSRFENSKTQVKQLLIKYRFDYASEILFHDMTFLNFYFIVLNEIHEMSSTQKTIDNSIYKIFCNLFFKQRNELRVSKKYISN